MNQQIDSNDQLTLILQNALNPDMNVRKQAEDQINHLIDQNFVQFLLELSLKISNEKEKRSSPNERHYNKEYDWERKVYCSMVSITRG